MFFVEGAGFGIEDVTEVSQFLLWINGRLGAGGAAQGTWVPCQTFCLQGFNCLPAQCIEAADWKEPVFLQVERQAGGVEVGATKFLQLLFQLAAGSGRVLRADDIRACVPVEAGAGAEAIFVAQGQREG